MKLSTIRGYGRIMAELKKLGIKVGRNTVKHYMIENGLNPSPKRYEDSWDAYIKRTFETLFACDFFSKTICLPVLDTRRTTPPFG